MVLWKGFQRAWMQCLNSCTFLPSKASTHTTEFKLLIFFFIRVPRFPCLFGGCTMGTMVVVVAYIFPY